MIAIACFVLIAICLYLLLVKCLASMACFAALFYMHGGEKVGVLVALVWNVFWAVVWGNVIVFLFHLP
ncbi:hypothetical protein [Pseudomonas phage vB_PaeS_TUMS_P81]|nr:hypothetical protein [Pseudomonas phage vB_PaeS_TUMS_P81]